MEKVLTICLFFVFVLGVFAQETIDISYYPVVMPKGEIENVYSPMLEFSYSGLSAGIYKIKVWLLYPYSSYPCSSSVWCERTYQVDNSLGNNSQGFLRAVTLTNVYSYPNNELLWVAELYNPSNIKVASITKNSLAITYKAPILGLVGNKIGYVGVPLNFQLSSVHPEGFSVFYSSTNLPTGASLSSSGNFNWTPSFKGTYKVYFHVRDNFDNYDSEEVLINVEDAPVPNISGFQNIFIPDCGSFLNVSGKVVSDAPLTDYRVVAYIFVSGSGWWVKPTFANPKTVINPDGTFNVDITTGGIDDLATIVYLGVCHKDLVVPTRPEEIPESIFNYGKFFHRDPSKCHRVISWSGYDWWVKDSRGGTLGPGQNFFSSSEQNVFVDSNGYLHLKIRWDGTKYLCSEIVSLKNFGYGFYEFVLTSGTSIHYNAVLGLFTWEDGTPLSLHNREIDIELSQWGNPSDLNMQYVIQPYNVSGNLFRFDMPLTYESIHKFCWESDRVVFQSFYNSLPWPKKEDIVSDWTYTGVYVPTKGSYVNVRLNLWIMDNKTLPALTDQEVVIKKFNFYCLEEIKGDINNDCVVDLSDLNALAQNWLVVLE